MSMPDARSSCDRSHWRLPKSSSTRCVANDDSFRDVFESRESGFFARPNVSSEPASSGAELVRPVGGAAATDFRPIPTIFYVDLRISAIAVGGETLAKQRQGSTGTQLFLLRPTFERSMSRDFGAERLIKAPVSYRHERRPNWWVLRTESLSDRVHRSPAQSWFGAFQKMLEWKAMGKRLQPSCG